MRMLQENFESALHVAIECGKDAEMEPSPFIRGLQEVLQASQRGETISIEPSIPHSSTHDSETL